MKEFELHFDLKDCEKLDQFALLACQEYNLGGKGDWFGCFRGGLYGFYSRIYGVHFHYYEVHAWRLSHRMLREPEYHLAQIFFNMDSAIECFTFAMNALGNAVAPSDFLNVTDERSLKRITPANILGTKTQAPQRGYARYFPTLQTYWQANEALLTTIVEQHDVSKHRSTIYVGGKYRTDMPPGFLEQLGIDAESAMRFEYSPMEEILLKPEPKVPRGKKTPVANYEDLETLESIGPRFCEFINQTSKEALADATRNIKLNHQTFLGRVAVVYQTNISLYEDPECEKKRNDVTGLILASETIGFGDGGLTRKRIVPTRRFSYYEKGNRVSEEDDANLSNVWPATWYFDPDDGQKKLAWQSSAEFVGNHII